MTMTVAVADGNREQAALWNGAAGRGWTEAQELLDQMFQPFAALLVEKAAGGGRVLDVGCGAGATTRALAASLGAGADCVGVDISESLIAAARGAAAREDSKARFVLGDAAVQDFADFDLLVSRFGISFFADPAQAFAHLRRATAPGGKLCFLTWRGAEENPFLTAAERAVGDLLALPPLTAHAPGPFALADKARAGNLFAAGGWRDVRIEAVDRLCTFPADGLTHYLRWMGPVGRLLQAASAEERARILNKVRPAFDVFVQGDEVRFNAACWTIEAEASHD